jgi:hypothetical protein
MAPGALRKSVAKYPLYLSMYVCMYVCMYVRGKYVLHLGIVCMYMCVHVCILNFNMTPGALRRSVAKYPLYLSMYACMHVCVCVFRIGLLLQVRYAKVLQNIHYT